MARLRTFARGTALAVLVGSALGCSQEPGAVSGEVTIGGKPLPGGVISFHSEVGSSPVVNAPIKDGKYTVSGVPSGNAIVTVGNPRPSPGCRPVPPRYGDPDTSGLTLIVQPGEQTFLVALTP
ncbi:hypothetical protein [Gemmata sp.]|uniref:hypothetical protein n=1 Tax=Gemmata sp. TaxID=1914242 RepID=UPI003F6E5695